ncbi:MAG TPA: GAF domain-containing protein [Rhodocyclaceae bacterium]|nr:GAF domain-containing protein [Rhodocyclaceae bacterium]
MVARRSLHVYSPLRLQEGLARLSQGEVFRGGSLDAVLSHLAEQAASLSGVERAGIWAFNAEHTELRCLELYTLSRHRHSAGEMMQTAHHGAYFDAMRRDGSVVADDVYTHPATGSFADVYLLRHGITAMLDTAIYVRGELQGILCLEQVGMRQPWSALHRVFAQAVANLMTLALVEFEAGEAKRNAAAVSERLHTVFESSRDAFLLTEEPTGVILDANREAERLFGYRRVELVGKLRQFLHPVTGEGGDSQQVRCHDGRLLPVAVSAEIAELGGGRQLALVIYRPLCEPTF